MEIKIFPNPAKDLINISISSSKYKSFNMDIYNPNGMVIKTTNINISGDYYSASYDLNDFNKGSYIFLFSCGTNMKFPVQVVLK